MKFKKKGQEMPSASKAFFILALMLLAACDAQGSGTSGTGYGQVKIGMPF
jgi:hypothetical protein